MQGIAVNDEIPEKTLLETIRFLCIRRLRAANHYTTNAGCTAMCGLTTAQAAGLMDLEFVQFHPTVLLHPETVLSDSEASRGRGNLLNSVVNAYACNIHAKKLRGCCVPGDF